jgi:hypothetical protein
MLVLQKITRLKKSLTSADSAMQVVVMKICANPKCSVYGRIVYALATRCPVCKWDLKTTLPASEAEPRTTQVAHAGS